MSEQGLRVLILLALWAGYFIAHSALASLRVKRWATSRWPALAPRYRLVYNAIALLLLLPPLYMTLFMRGEYLWQWSGVWAWLANGLALLAGLGFLWTLRYYSGLDFIGLRQWQTDDQSIGDREAFKISPLHRHVRHPWYALGLVIIWTRDMDLMFLTSAVAITIYLFIGSRLEERKLVAYHGDAYRRYRKSVPGIIPRPWRHLKKQDAQELLESRHRERP
jgi:protein-S-isoprenylcysteine O-methyltransferase Ste14